MTSLYRMSILSKDNCNNYNPVCCGGKVGNADEGESKTETRKRKKEEKKKEENFCFTGIASDSRDPLKLFEHTLYTLSI